MKPPLPKKLRKNTPGYPGIPHEPDVVDGVPLKPQCGSSKYTKLESF
jgi:hypothetical protein